MKTNTDAERETRENTSDASGGKTRSANTGGKIPNDAASLDLDYDPGASPLSEDIADEVAKSGLGIGSAEDRRGTRPK